MGVVMPKGVVAWDGNGDGRLEDEIRVVYAAVGDETPGFFISQASNADTIVVSSGKVAAAGGVIYLQFPVLALEQQQLLELLEPVLDAEFPDLIRSPYQQISFGDAREDTISPGPELTIVSKNIIELQVLVNSIWMSKEEPFKKSLMKSKGLYAKLYKLQFANQARLINKIVKLEDYIDKKN